jgi:hypothetical protein
MAAAKPEKTPLELYAELEEAHQNALAQIRLDAAKSGANGYTLKLVDPIMVGSTKVTELHFRPQTVADVRKNPEGDAFTAALCNLSPEQITQLAIDDWDGAQAVLAGFAMRRAAGGPARSTKTT